MSSCSRGNYNPRYSCCYEDAGSPEVQRKCTVGLWNDASVPRKIRPKRIKTVSCTENSTAKAQWEYICGIRGKKDDVIKYPCANHDGFLSAQARARWVVFQSPAVLSKKFWASYHFQCNEVPYIEVVVGREWRHTIILVSPLQLDGLRATLYLEPPRGPNMAAVAILIIQFHVAVFRSRPWLCCCGLSAEQYYILLTYVIYLYPHLFGPLRVIFRTYVSVSHQPRFASGSARLEIRFYRLLSHPETIESWSYLHCLYSVEMLNVILGHIVKPYIPVDSVTGRLIRVSKE